MPSSAQPNPALPRTTTRPFQGLWLPLITPFDDAGQVDHLSLAALTRHYSQSSQGLSGLVVCGSTGEAAALSAQEQQAVLDTVLAHTPLPVVMGLSGYHLGHTLEWVSALARYPLAGWLVPAPHYIRPSQAGLQRWFECIADRAQAPLIIYDIPYRTGATLSLSTLLALAAHPHIQAIKDCGGDAAKTQALIQDGRLQVLAGEDAQIFSTLALGGHGAIAASAHWQTRRFADLLARLSESDLPAARTLWQGLQAMIQALFAEPNPAPVKALLAAQGLIRPHLREPMMAASAALQQHLLTLERAAR
ncbi:MAG: 4-hydroxy-tetrahydrodipicolinate synthase [Curvibacter sp.]|nr:MAG: 4-hydroxy-tetrahydrodipicolinate synthase [Curvibacter sp.]